MKRRKRPPPYPTQPKKTKKSKTVPVFPNHSSAGFVARHYRQQPTARGCTHPPAPGLRPSSPPGTALPGPSQPRRPKPHPCAGPSRPRRRPPSTAPFSLTAHSPKPPLPPFFALGVQSLRSISTSAKNPGPAPRGRAASPQPAPNQAGAGHLPAAPTLP
jgi:hypothetical protein